MRIIHKIRIKYLIWAINRLIRGAKLQTCFECGTRFGVSDNLCTAHKYLEDPGE